MRLERMGAAIAAVVMGSSFLGWATPADAACRQVLAPNRWQYITQCDSYSGGGGGGGGEIGAAIGLAGAAIEAAPAIAGLLGGILSTAGDLVGGVAEVGSGVVSGVGDAASGLTTAAAAPVADTGATSFNPFNIFDRGPDVPCTDKDRARGCRNIKGNAAAFGNGAKGDDQYVVDPGGCSANRAVRGGCPKMEPRVTCNDRGCYTEYVRVPPPPKKTAKGKGKGKRRG